MNYLLFGENAKREFKVAILIPTNGFKRTEIEKYYIDPLADAGIKRNEIIAFELDMGTGKKPTIKVINKYLEDLFPKLNVLKIQHILCCDSNYFIKLARKRKSTPWYCYKLPVNTQESFVFLGINHTSFFYNPITKATLKSVLKSLTDSIFGRYREPGNIIKSAYYPDTVEKIAEALKDLHQYKELTLDIETKSLKIDEAGIETIGFSWNDYEGISFVVDKDMNPDRIPTAKLLKEFLTEFKGKWVGHNLGFDFKILIYELWMNDIDDTEGLLDGLEILTRDFDDTQIIAYLATNTTAGNKLSLKDLAQEYAGNYAQDDIKDTTLIPAPKLMEYNLEDCCATWWTKNKYYPMMCEDGQLDIYRELFIPIVKVLIQTELTGMPLDMDEVRRAENTLKGYVETNITIIRTSRYIQNFNFWLQHVERKKANAKLKVKVHPYSHFEGTEINVGSGKQVGEFLHEFLGYDVIDTTPEGLPATGNDSLKKLAYHVDDETRKIIECIMEINTAQKILSTFIKAFKEKSILHGDGYYYLHGGFNITGTQSHRLSSSNPNLQNLPSGSKYGKVIKSCFVSPPNRLMVGADFNALEARIGALLTKDPNKMKIYTEGYDSHSLAAFNYWPDEFPDIIDTPESVNTIADKYGELRSKSKTVTFAAQYGGTFHTFMASGFSKEEAQKIEANYHKMYQVSDEWVIEHIKEACRTGFVPLAFGGRLRTPVLQQVIYGNHMPYKASEEMRSAGNALMQSYGLLNNRAITEFMGRVWESKYKTKIHPIAMVHDSIYLVIERNIGCVKWVNDNLIECMDWQELPEIKDSSIGLPAELDLHYPSWKQAITLPNKLGKRAIINLINKD